MGVSVEACPVGDGEGVNVPTDGDGVSVDCGSAVGEAVSVEAVVSGVPVSNDGAEVGVKASGEGDSVAVSVLVGTIVRVEAGVSVAVGCAGVADAGSREGVPVSIGGEGSSVEGGSEAVAGVSPGGVVEDSSCGRDRGEAAKSERLKPMLRLTRHQRERGARRETWAMVVPPVDPRRRDDGDPREVERCAAFSYR